jgi:xanthine dehydrogenase accessory factor
LELLWCLELGIWSFLPSMNDTILDELLRARTARTSCALVTVAATKGSVPREPGSKMIVYGNGKTSGTIGGGKFESLVSEEAIRAMREKKPLLKTYPLHEGDACSFGAICGGEVTIFIEPQMLREAIYLVGAGHCARAVAKLAIDCGLFVTVVDDRVELLADLPEAVAKVSTPAADFIRERKWNPDEALVLVSRNHEIDRDALRAALAVGGAGYVGMIGSRRKVQHVFDQLREQGVTRETLANVYAPLGLDIGADSPAEIAVSVVAEVLAVLRKRSGEHFRMQK